MDQATIDERIRTTPARADKYPAACLACGGDIHGGRAFSCQERCAMELPQSAREEWYRTRFHPAAPPFAPPRAPALPTCALRAGTGFYSPDMGPVRDCPDCKPAQLLFVCKRGECPNPVAAFGEYCSRCTPPPVAAPSKGAALRVGDRVRLLKGCGGGNTKGTVYAIAKEGTGGCGEVPGLTFLLSAEGIWWERVPADNVCNERAAGEAGNRAGDARKAPTAPQPSPRPAPVGMSALEISEAVEAGRKHGAVALLPPDWVDETEVARAPGVAPFAAFDNAGDMLDLLPDVGR